MPEHGGRLQQAAQRYGIAVDDWLDLSTGIAPWSLPLPAIPERIWNRLPEPEDDLLPAARDYYGCPSLLATPGSQAAIQLLPQLRPVGRVGILGPTYAEHGACWQQSGHSVEYGSGEPAPDWLATLDVLIVVNPNNPTGRCHSPGQLLDWHRQLQTRGGWLIVDEAFMDCRPEASLASQSGQPGLIVLRSVGKFFGLAGARLGFMLAEPGLCAQLEARLGPWPISGPSRWVVSQLLRDHSGQQRQRQQLQAARQRLEQCLQACGLDPVGGTDLFQWLILEQAASLHQALARQGILTRLFPDLDGLRIGLPATAADNRRLQQALYTEFTCRR